MSKNKIVISGTGCALVDFLYTKVKFDGYNFLKYQSNNPGDGGLSPGKLVFTEELEKFADKIYSEIVFEVTEKAPFDSFNVGGPGLVSLIHTSQMLSENDYEVRFFGMAGNDDIADIIFLMLNRTPLKIDNYKKAGLKPTPFTHVFSDPTYDNGHGERTFVNNIGAAWDYTPEMLTNDFFASDIVCFGGTALVPHIHDNLTELLRKAKGKQSITIVNTVYDFRNEKLNPGQKWPLVKKDEDFSLIDILIMDKEEALKISGEDSIEKATGYFQTRDVSTCVITNGSGNITAWSNGKLFSQTPVFQLPVLAKVAEDKARTGDTTGCGDNFAGGIIASVAEQLKTVSTGNLNLHQAVAFAVASGGFACSYIGGTYLEKKSNEKRENILQYKDDYMKQLSRQGFSL